MGTPMPDRPCRLRPTAMWAHAVLCGALAWSPQALAQAAAPAAAAASAAPLNSAMDDRLFYQLLIGEMALGSGDAGSAYELMLDAARRTRDEGLFRRAVDIALRGRAGDQALAASRAWRLARPESADAVRLQLQILLALNRKDGLDEPLRALLGLTAPGDRAGLISALPRFLQRAGDARAVAALMEDALKPYREADATRPVALGFFSTAFVLAMTLPVVLYGLDPERIARWTQQAASGLFQ